VWAVTRPEHGQLGFLRLDWLVNERIGDLPLVEKGRNESIGKDHLSAKPVKPQLGSLATHLVLERLSGYY
jgi:hypothetical protein